MKEYTQLKEHYKFTEEEALILKKLQPRMEKLADTFIDNFMIIFGALVEQQNI